MTKPKRGTGNRFRSASTFYEHLKLALEFHSNPTILRNNSPLATPYFLRQDTPNTSAQQIQYPSREEEYHWGQRLASAIDAAMNALWPQTPPKSKAELLAGLDLTEPKASASCYHYYVLELNYFKKLYTPAPKTQSEIYNDILHIGRTTHDRHLKEAVEHLGDILLKQLRPTMRLEMPTHAGTFIGRESILAECMERLAQQESISFTGSGGIGKTTLATKIAEEWRPNPTFWFTIRHNFNDRLPSLLFALGYFLHQHGGSGLWLQLVANGGTIDDPNLALSLVLSDIEQLTTTPLLCFDEIDLLQTMDLDSTPEHHILMLTFIESLRSTAPLLFIGQQAVIETNITFMLERLTQAEIGLWLDTIRISYSPADLERLESYTKGNPRLLTLCFAYHYSLLIDTDSKLADTLARLPESPGLLPIWTRVRRRLSANEVRLLYAIAVFRGPTPVDAWLADEGMDSAGLEDALPNAQESADSYLVAQRTFARLLERQLLFEDGRGGVMLLPALSKIIYQEMAVEEREAAHLHAAYICASRGEVTEAAYHFSHGGHPSEAIRYWYPKMEQEIQRGQIASALPIFAEISAQHLKPAQQKQLAIIRGELYQLRGEPELAAKSLEQVTWSKTEPLGVKAHYLWGKALDAQGETYRAQEKLGNGIEAAAHLMQEMSQLHVTRGLIHMHEREMAEASHEVTWARFHTEMLEGAIQTKMGKFTIAQECLSSAVALAEKLADPSALGRAHYYLGNAAGMQHKFDLAFHHYEQSMAQYRDIGNQVEEAQLRTNLAHMHFTAGNYTIAIQEATEALAFFKRMKSPYWSALNANTVAEAYFELGDSTNAELYAMEVIGYEDTQFFPFGLFTLGSVRRANQMLKEAQNLYSQSCQIAEENEDRFLLAYAKRALGEVEAELGNLEVGRENLNEAFMLFQQMEIGPEIEKTKLQLEAIG